MGLATGGGCSSVPAAQQRDPVSSHDPDPPPPDSAPCRRVRAEEKSQLEPIHADVDTLANLVKENAKLKEMLFNPIVDSDKKTEVCWRIACSSFQPGARQGAGETRYTPRSLPQLQRRWQTALLYR